MIECIALSTMMPAETPSSSIVCLGNFDGVHLAHRKLLRSTLEMREKRFPNAACAVFCFREPPSLLLKMGAVSFLSTLEEKLTYFREEGIEYAFLADFYKLQAYSPSQFAKSILKEACSCVAAVCGFNYHFGKNGSGNASMLSQLLQAPVWIQSEIKSDGETVSSTYIRKLLCEGDVQKANRLLCRPFSFQAEVVHGKALGQKLGAPTMNQFFPRYTLIPRLGVYVTDCEIDGIVYRGISNVGNHPTVDQNAHVNCETHLLDFSGDLYGKNVRVSFLAFIRPEMKFESAAALQAQIQKDIAFAKQEQF